MGTNYMEASVALDGGGCCISTSAGAGNPEVKLVHEALSSLPPVAVKELQSLGICSRCIIRFSCKMESITPCMLLSTSVLTSALRELITVDEDTKGNNEETELQLCQICLGILQFVYCNEEGLLMKKECAVDFSVVIAEVAKQDGHQIDSFSLEVSVPSLITENEEIVWLHMKEKYASELWFSELSRRTSVKDILKVSIMNQLENLLGNKSGPSSIRIRLTYSHSNGSTKAESSVAIKTISKRRKIGNVVQVSEKATCAVPSQISDICPSKEDGDESHDQIEVLFEKVNEPCKLTFHCHRTSVYVGGRYLKYSRNVSQTRWIIDDERKGEASVEELIGGSILPLCKGDNYKFHAAGREDIDVRMLGSGRPFLIEIQNACHVPCNTTLKEIEEQINNRESKLVAVKNLKLLDSKLWALMREGEAEKQKQYTALVWISRPLSDDDLKTLSSFKDMPVLQRTPIRVLHRRSPLDREKIIHWMKVETIAGNSQYFLLHLCTQAGTYIKEFVHGDLARTHPSVGSILGCRAEILQLDVTDVKMDCF
ncbi:tRNA pseudouridine synthase Pus10 [Impatiens glandulifera]|uniref:tRNA pseudouridine synthase Pus10 n=1 Tax=Impatiens glandulifera TaxID=253017 RepID=UPI001FB194F2|nr:tRNA pseudouridine synthase Pus10 [Impatiens glandulifera]